LVYEFKEAPDLRKDWGLNFLKHFAEHETLFYPKNKNFLEIK
jgi:hypothetical protein